MGLGADREMWGVEVDIEGRDEHVVSRGTKVRIVEGLVVRASKYAGQGRGFRTRRHRGQGGRDLESWKAGRNTVIMLLKSHGAYVNSGHSKALRVRYHLEKQLCLDWRCQCPDDTKAKAAHTVFDRTL